jgi:hypothetical protein
LRGFKLPLAIFAGFLLVTKDENLIALSALPLQNSSKEFLLIRDSSIPDVQAVRFSL